MSEYQHYEWQTVDRLLTENEQQAVSSLSSHIEVSSSRAVVTYSWGDFKHNPRQVLARFFDAHVYLANWGSRRLLLRFPAGLLSPSTIAPFCVQDHIAFNAIEGSDVLDMDLSEEEAGNWIEGGGWLSGLIPLRNDILGGDYRSLYLAWLKAMDLTGGEPSRRKQNDSEGQPPIVPAGLGQLSPALKRFVDLFEIPAGLIEAAAENSSPAVESEAVDFLPLAARLPRDVCDAFLGRVAQGDARVGLELRARLLAQLPPRRTGGEVRLAFGQLQQRAETIEAEREAREQARERKQHEAEMKALASREEATWGQVALLVGLKKTTSYDEAVQLLVKLAQLAAFRGTQADFRQRVRDLCERYRRLTGFRWRVEDAKLLDDEIA